ncbi:MULTISPECIES: nucleotidyltransferase domain-containing protein [Microbacterium]|uniref:nucleotidyltransferase domain-containing protein n=1 Tax=Microbacterium TaxID=33882 RepID=UPI00068924F9|nr:nucleotidyltransferase domain-containing protein [Microbacterium profundi]
MEVLSVADARAGLSRLIAGLRDNPAAAPVAIGSHRKPEAVLLSVDEYQRVSDREPARITVERLRQLGPLIERLAQAAHLRDVQVYGSVARGDQAADSDLDLLVTADDATLFDIAQFEMDIEMLVGVPVSAVSVASLDRKRDARILNEAVLL